MPLNGLVRHAETLERQLGTTTLPWQRWAVRMSFRRSSHDFFTGKDQCLCDARHFSCWHHMWCTTQRVQALRSSQQRRDAIDC